MWQHISNDGQRTICDLCPRHCALKSGERGYCFVRENRDGNVVSTTYGRSTGFCVDPIEKKPLHHFHPGSPVLSFGTAGCNLGCRYCQNWTTTRSRDVDIAAVAASPDAIVATARRLGCRSVAFTYNEPVVWAEYVIDTAKACHADADESHRIKTVAVTSGYITDIARPDFFEHIDAANVDLKGFTDEFYRMFCNGRLQPVLDTLVWLAREKRVWVEITNLIIPRANDSPDEIRRMCEWIATELGVDVPLHFSAFHPDYELLDREATPPATLRAAYDIARRAGLNYVYTGNIFDPEHQDTYCPGCGRAVIRRSGFDIESYDLVEGHCLHCQRLIAGRFDAKPGDWGGRRMPVAIE